jgi:dTDP-4-amino-4,6-dideoxygalactose transaminase
MHATKSFATGEAGLIYSADTAAIAQLRQMSNFGFGAPRTATMPGLNGKLSETGALLGQLRLDSYDATMAQREKMVQRYRDGLPALTFQAAQPGRQAHQFASALLPAALAPQRAEILAALAASGIGTGTYFSPHLAQQPYFAEMAPPSRLPVSDDVAARVISLPLSDTLDGNDCAEVIDTLNAELACRAYGARPNTFTVL